VGKTVAASPPQFSPPHRSPCRTKGNTLARPTPCTGSLSRKENPASVAIRSCSRPTKSLSCWPRRRTSSGVGTSPSAPGLPERGSPAIEFAARTRTEQQRGERSAVRLCCYKLIAGAFDHNGAVRLTVERAPVSFVPPITLVPDTFSFGRRLTNSTASPDRDTRTTAPGPHTGSRYGRSSDASIATAAMPRLFKQASSGRQPGRGLPMPLRIMRPATPLREPG
jgi:hypothetical protein